RAATFHSQTQSQGCALPDADISRQKPTRKAREIPRKRRETAAAARRQRLSRRDRGGKRQNRALRRWTGFSEDDERVRRTRSTFGAGGEDLPATAFHQHILSLFAVFLLFQPIGFRSRSNNGLCGKMNKELQALERKLEIRKRELAEAHSHIAVLEEKLLKLKQYRRELKALKEERRTLRKSPERRIGQVLRAPYRVLEKPLKTVWRKLHQQKPTFGNSFAQSE